MKNSVKLIAITALTAAVVACNSGGGSGSSPATLTITSVTAPTGSAPAKIWALAWVLAQFLSILQLVIHYIY